MKNLFLFVLIFIFWGCTTKTKNTVPDIEPPQAIKLSNFQLKIPSGWKAVATSSTMRLAEFTVEGEHSARVAAFYFGNPEKSKEQIKEENVKRWKGQFTKVEEEKEIPTESSETFLIYLQGIFILKPFPMAEKGEDTPNYAVLNGMIHSPEGPYFFRWEGRKEQVLAQINNFKQFFNSYQKIKE